MYRKPKWRKVYIVKLIELRENVLDLYYSKFKYFNVTIRRNLGLRSSRALILVVDKLPRIERLKIYEKRILDMAVPLTT